MILKKTFNVSYSNVGCIILTEPLFFEEKDWISPPDNWPSNTVVGKVYDMEKDEGRRLFKEVCDRLQRKSVSSQVVINDIKEPYKYSFVKHRLGQGAFRVLVTDAYFRQCAIVEKSTSCIRSCIYRTLCRKRTSSYSKWRTFMQIYISYSIMDT